MTMQPQCVSRPAAAALLLTACLQFAAACNGSGSGASRLDDDDAEDPGDYHYLCEVAFAVGGSESTYEEVGVGVRFLSSLGTFLVDEGGARCRSALARPAAGEQAGQNNSPSKPEEQERDFFVTLDDPEGLGLPADFVSCAFLARTELVAENFFVSASVWQAVGTTGTPNPWDGRPVTVSVADCKPFPDPSGETSTTTTTLDACVTTLCEAGELCVDGACEAAETGRLELQLESAAAPVGSVQFQIDYGDSGAVFVHADGKRACEPGRGMANSIYADCDFRSAESCSVLPGFHRGELGIGIAALQTFEAPQLLASCEVAAVDLEAAVAGMRIEPVEVTDEEFERIGGTISMRLVRE